MAYPTALKARLLFALVCLVNGCGGTVVPPSGAGGRSEYGGSSGSADGAGVAGAGGRADARGGAGGAGTVCDEPQAPGACDASELRYWFNAKTGVCQAFHDTGCSGNGNNFETADACYLACEGAAQSDVTSCSGPGDCVVESPGCCGACDRGDEAYLVAIRAQSSAEYQGALHCDGIACGQCPAADPTLHEVPYFGATCRSGRCVLFDARATDIGACTTDRDCSLRNGLDCCETCGEHLERLVAVNRSAAIPGCGGAVACDPCMPSYPERYVPICADGHCGIALRPR